MHSPIQNAEKFPATKPDRMFSEAPPCLEQLVTSRTCLEFVLTKTFVNSGISAPATVPQLMMHDSTHHSAGWAVPLASLKSPSSSLLAKKVMPIETNEVSQTRCVSGASKSKSFLPPNIDLLMPSLKKRETREVIMIRERITKSQMMLVSGASKSKSFWPPNIDLLMPSLTK